MVKKLINWIIFNVAFALFPLLSVIGLHSLNATLTRQTIADSPEILFFSLMVSATALGDLDDMPTKPAQWDWIFRIFWGLLFLGAVVSTLLYGFLLYDRTMAPQTTAFRDNLLKASVWFAVVYGLLSTVVEALIAYVDTKIEKVEGVS